MRVVVALLLLIGAVHADPAADAVLKAFRAKQDLKPLASKDDPDPWRVADELCSRAEFDAAAAFATAAPRPDVERLPDYVRARQRGPVARGVSWIVARHAAGLKAKDPKAHVEAAGAAKALGWLAMEYRAQSFAWLHYQKGGDPAAARVVIEAQVHNAQAQEHQARVGGALGRLAVTLESLKEHDLAIETGKKALAASTAAKDDPRIAMNLRNLGLFHRDRGRYRDAVSFFERAAVVHARLDDVSAQGDERFFIGMIWLRELEDAGKALRSLERAAELFSRAQRPRDVAHARVKRADALLELGRAERAQEEIEVLLERIRTDDPLWADAQNVLGVAKIELGDYAGARACFERLPKSLPAGIRSTVLANLASCHAATGDLSAALGCAERAVELAEEGGSPRVIATARLTLGSMLARLGDNERALVVLARVGPGARLVDRGSARGAMGVAYQKLRRYEPARAAYADALAVYVKLGIARLAANAQLNLGLVLSSMSHHDEAIANIKEAVRLWKSPTGHDLLALSSVLQAAGDVAGSRKYGLMAIERATRAGAVRDRIYGHWQLATLEPAGTSGAKAALGQIRQATALLPSLVGGLADGEGALAREGFAMLFQEGARIAIDLKDFETAFHLWESGRAMTLLESLHGRDRLARFVLPEHLLHAERRARQQLKVATSAYRATLDGEGDADAAWRKLERAREASVAVGQRARREAKRAADVVYPRPVPLKQLQAALGVNEALIVFGVAPRTASALVVTRRSVRASHLGDVTEQVEQLRAALARPERGVTRPPHRRWDHLARSFGKRLRAAIKLDESVRRVIVAPHGALTHVPFAMLFPDRTVHVVPSATTWVQLRSDAALRGTGVLALGDPAVRDLAPLSGSRDEAEAVGDVVLLGKDASAARLTAALGKRERWRSVHFACHGVVRADKPMLSALALAPDGAFSVSDVFRSSIPADLVVLSACASGVGRTYAAEGVLGFTRAFMCAGTPRVIVSLWRVDDQATRELMVKFYELWKKHPTAEALKMAQSHVRDHKEEWKHPYYWAAWQLWGCGE